MRKKAFTLIELIAVLVILAILALIVTPLVMNIIRKARVAADKRSVDAYGRSVELAISSYVLETGFLPTDLSSLEVKYKGKVVVCNVMQMKENGGLYLSECTVGNNEVKDSSTDDGWYHYGTRDLTNEEYVDMYGKSIEKSLKEYHETNNTYPSDYRDLTLDYSGKEVLCEVSINYDGTVYLNNCKVTGIAIDYIYGRNEPYKSFETGDEVTYNNVDYYVITDSGTNESSITLLKAEPLTVAEVNQYGGAGTANNHVNRYSGHSVGTAYNRNDYGNLAYYSSTTCGLYRSRWVYDGCTTDYAQSDIKYVVDSWKTAQAPSATEARLITFDEVSSLGFELVDNGSAVFLQRTENTPTWVYNRNYEYWTMSQYNDSAVDVSVVSNVGSLTHYGVHSGNGFGTVRPVITIKKSALNE